MRKVNHEITVTKVCNPSFGHPPFLYRFVSDGEGVADRLLPVLLAGFGFNLFSLGVVHLIEKMTDRFAQKFSWELIVAAPLRR